MNVRMSLLFAMILSVSSRRIKRKSKTGEAGWLRNVQKDRFNTSCKTDDECRKGAANSLLECDPESKMCLLGAGGECTHKKMCVSGLVCVGEGMSPEKHSEIPGTCQKDEDEKKLPENFADSEIETEADCNSDKECNARALTVCENKKCKSVPGGSCQQDEDCASGLVCNEYKWNGKKCHLDDNHCNFDEDCYEGDIMVCDKNQCKSGQGGLCKLDKGSKDCASGLVCNVFKWNGEKSIICMDESDKWLASGAD